jgi:hypothetical protein
MFQYIKTIFSSPDEQTYGAKRSSLWPTIRDRYIKSNPKCAVCGSTKNVVAHHIIPFYINPNKELDETNLITLCEGKTLNCHLLIGHLMCWKSYNKDVVEDCRQWNRKINERPS